MAERPEACADRRDDLAGWLMAQLSPEREVELMAHLSTCAACRDEAASLLAVSAVALTADPDDPMVDDLVSAFADPLGREAEPSPELAQRIAATVAAERRGQRIVRAGLALLVAAAAVVATVVVWTDDGPAPVHGEEVAFAVVPPGARADAVVADDDGGTLVQLTASGLDPEVTYALWLSPPHGDWEDRVAAGTFRPDADGAVDVRLRCALPADAYTRIWATTPDGQVALDTEAT
jgi:hypothetical protein